MRASTPVTTEEIAFKDLSNAVLEILDRQADTTTNDTKSQNDRKASAAQLHSKAAEITETLKVSIHHPIIFVPYLPSEMTWRMYVAD